MGARRPTALRILLVPLLVIVLAIVEPGAGTWSGPRLLAIGLYVFAASTDWLDGYLARRLRVTTRWGSMADAAADRLLLLVPLLYLAVRRPPAFAAIPLWLPLWILGLDAAMGTALAAAHRRRGEGVPDRHNLSGRAAIWVLSAALLWAVAALPAPGAVILGAAGAGLATTSAILYILRWRAG